MEEDTLLTSDIVDKSTGEVIEERMTFSQAYGIWKRFIEDNKSRNAKNAAISRKLNGEQPWSASKLKAAGQSWRSNRPTGFMNSLMKRLMPPYKQVVDQLPFLTYARFSNSEIGSEADAIKFRKAITNCIRSWIGWPDFISQLVDEDIGFGYAAVGWDDEYGWKPKVLRSDAALFYVGCPQVADEVKCWAYREDFFVDAVVKILRDIDMAKAAGWQVKNLISKLNGASEQFSDRDSDENVRLQEDLIRENNLSASFTSTVRVIKAAHLLAVNPAGGVDHYIFDREDGTALFYRRARYSLMSQCLALFTAEVGDGTLHGSRGAGRALYNTHVSVEQARNLIQDALYLNGLLVLSRTSKGSAIGAAEAPSLTVAHPFAIVGEGFEVIQNVKFDVNAEAFFAMDRQATSQAEVLIGAFMPGQMTDQGGGRKTASEVNYVASIDAQIRAGVLARFADQAFPLMNQIQRRICNPDVLKYCESLSSMFTEKPIFIYDQVEYEAVQAVLSPEESKKYVLVDPPSYIDKDAVQCVMGMISDGLTLAAVALLANSSSKASVEDVIASQSGVLDILMSRYAADPVIDSVELKRRDISSKIGADGAERLLNVSLNPLSAVKQQRQQILELTALAEGTPVPVDPTDDDTIHLSVMADRLVNTLKGAVQIPLSSARQFVQAVVEHAQAHIQSASQKGTDLKSIADVLDVFKQAEKLLGSSPTPALDQQAQNIVNSVGPQLAAPVSLEDAGIRELGDPTQIVNDSANPTKPTPPSPDDLQSVALSPLTNAINP